MADEPPLIDITASEPAAATDASVSPAPISPPMLEWLQKQLNQENVATAFQFIKGPTLAAAASFGSPLGILAAGAALVGVGIYRVNYIDTAIKKRLLAQYKREISHALDDKPLDALTVRDVEPAMKILGKDNALSIELEYNRKAHRFYNILNIITTVALTALMAVTAGLVEPQVFKETFSMIASGLVGGTIAGGIKKGVSQFIEQPQRPKVNAAIADITKQLKSGPATPDKVFAVFVEADPALKERIKQHYGEEFQDLALAAKRKIIDDNEEIYSTKAWTLKINRQEVQPTALGFIPYEAQHARAASLLIDTAHESTTPPIGLGQDKVIGINEARLALERANSSKRVR